MENNFYIARLFDWQPRGPVDVIRRANRVLQRLGSTRLIPTRPPSGMMTNVEQRINLYHLMGQVLACGVNGEFVEFGCHEGQVGVLMGLVMRAVGDVRDVHLYDSFEGLPARDRRDGHTPFKAGMLRPSLERLHSNFEEMGLPEPIVHVGWFDQLMPDDIPPTVAFAHLDGDFYSSTIRALELVYDRLAPNAICVVDDFADPSINPHWDLLPGVKAACDEFLADKAEHMVSLWAGDYSHGYFRKR